MEVVTENYNNLFVEKINFDLDSLNLTKTKSSELAIKLDDGTKSQLTPNYIKSILNSPWVEVNKQIEHAYYSNDVELINELVIKYSTQLLIDEQKLKQGEKVSECGLFAIRAHSTYSRSDRVVRFSHKIGELMFMQGTKPRASNLIHAISIYSQVISKLSAQYVKQYTEDFILNNKFKLARILEHDRGNFCLLKNRPIGDAVNEPTAMPVDVSPFEELEEFFKFLDSNGEVVVNNFGEDPCMEFGRGAIYEDKRMDLCKQVVGPTWIGNLMKSLESNDKVEHFLLGNNIIGEAGGKAIKEFLLNPHVPKIKTWYVAGNNLNSKAISNIVDGLKSDPDMQSLWLKRNPLKPEGIQHIARLLKSNQKIKVLDLHNTAVLDKGIEYLVEGLKANKSLRHLYLDANGLTEACIDNLIDYFEYLISNDLIGVTSLWLDMNKLFDSGVSKLVKVLGQYKHLKRLVLGSNGLTDACVDDIVDAFVDHPNLIVLDIGMYKSTSDMGMITNNIGDSGASKLCRLIESNKKIIFLNIMMNGIKEKGLELIGEATKKNNSLLYFEYKQYGVQTPQTVNTIIRKKLKANWEDCKSKGIPVVPLRILKHGKNIRFIDSIYRNSIK